MLHVQFPSNVIFSKNFILHNLPYFLTGMLIVDLYVSKKSYGLSANNPAAAESKAKLLSWDIIGLLSAIMTTCLLSFSTYSSYLPFTLGTFVLATLSGFWLKRLLSLRFFTIFGGMCYSIYLVHEHILSNSYYLFFPSFFNKYAPNGLNYLGILSMALWILIASIPFFLLVEKPFMNTKSGSK